VKKKTALLSLVLASSSLLAACGGDKATGGETTKKPADNGTAEKPAEAREQVLNLLAASEIPSMDSAIATDSVSFLVLNNVMEGLFRIDENGDLVDGMAEVASIQKSEDGKKYTFKIRDAKWSNGDPVTAHDFVYAWRKVVDPNTASEYAYIMNDIKNAAEIQGKKASPDQLGVKAIDDKTLEVELVNNIPYFEKLTTFPVFFPQNQKFVESQGDKYGLEFNTAVYNGPFVLADWKHEQSWQYKKNPNYWDAGTVKLEAINVNVVKDVGAGVNLYETKKVDRVGLSSEYVDKYKQDPNFKTEADASVFFLRQNTTNEVLKNVKARQAIAKGFDKEGIATVILNNGSTPANGLVPKEFVKSPAGVDFREENGDILAYNAEEAKKLWEEAKKELGKDTFEIELLNYDDDNSKKVGEFLKEQWETNLPGLTVNIKQQPFKQKLELESKMQYDITFAGWGPDYPDPMTFMDMFVTDGAHNQTGWSNAEHDKLIADAKSTLLSDLQARWNAMLKAEKIMLEEAPIAPMFQRGTSFLEREYVKGIVSYQFGADFSYKWAHLE
jgi:oligopeptide transport system substrate-binding protein